MIFLDSSALLKRYVLEAGHDLTIEVMGADSVWVASALARTEVMVALHRVSAGPHQQRRLWHAFRDDWDAFTVVPVDDRCLARAVEVGARFAVRMVDAIHLAAADRLPRPVRYLTFESQQIPAATGLGFEVVSPVGR